MRSCEIEGCDSRYVARGMCRRHYRRAYGAGGFTPPKRQTLRERFDSRYKVDPLTGCWVWAAHRDRNGYGLISIARKGNFAAHRVGYELLVGPIPSGLQIDHLCRNPPCVNPAHLEPVTQQENIRRGDGASARNARKTHCIAGHPFGGENLKIDTYGRRVCRTCRKASEKRIREKRKAQRAAA